MPELRERLDDFMTGHVYPAEAVYEEEVAAAAATICFTSAPPTQGGRGPARARAARSVLPSP